MEHIFLCYEKSGFYELAGTVIVYLALRKRYIQIAFFSIDKQVL